MFISFDNDSMLAGKWICSIFFLSATQNSWFCCGYCFISLSGIACRWKTKTKTKSLDSKQHQPTFQQHHKIASSVFMFNILNSVNSSLYERIYSAECYFSLVCLLTRYAHLSAQPTTCKLFIRSCWNSADVIVIIFNYSVFQISTALIAQSAKMFSSYFQ